MKPKRFVIGAVAAIVLVLSTLSAPASGGPPTNAVTAWQYPTMGLSSPTRRGRHSVSGRFWQGL